MEDGHNADVPYHGRHQRLSGQQLHRIFVLVHGDEGFAQEITDRFATLQRFHEILNDAGTCLISLRVIIRVASDHLDY